MVTIKDFKTEFLTTGDDLDVSATTRFKKHKRGAPFERGREVRVEIDSRNNNINH